tara:strand:+ start:2609 stop:3367 length:759 start_codon:yes stop_codon:yes gene_type:complete
MGAIFLFDVDGTLTPAKEKIDKSFANEFVNWMADREVYVVSGGSFVRIINQLGLDILERCAGVFACMGNIFYQKIDTINDVGYSQWEVVYENKFFAPKGLYKDLDNIVKNSKYHTKTGKHHEERVGMINFSIVGRNATIEQRKEYSIFDKSNEERKEIVKLLKENYTSLDFAIGGAVSIDIFNIGNDKSQIIDKHFGDSFNNNKVIFFGDRITFPGNDYPLATALNEYKSACSYEVKDWQETAHILNTSQFV